MPVAPFGKRSCTTPDGKVSVEIDPAEDRIVKFIVFLYTQGIDTAAIVRTLEAEGLQCRGKHWHRSTVLRVVERAGVHVPKPHQHGKRKPRGTT